MLYQFFFYAERGSAFVRDQSDSVADSENVGVDGHPGLLKNDSLYDISSLSAHSGKLFQLFAS
jgi:hypothetical protein